MAKWWRVRHLLKEQEYLFIFFPLSFIMYPLAQLGTRCIKLLYSNVSADASSYGTRNKHSGHLASFSSPSGNGRFCFVSRSCSPRLKESEVSVYHVLKVALEVAGELRWVVKRGTFHLSIIAFKVAFPTPWDCFDFCDWQRKTLEVPRSYVICGKGENHGGWLRMYWNMRRSILGSAGMDIVGFEGWLF